MVKFRPQVKIDIYIYIIHIQKSNLLHSPFLRREKQNIMRGYFEKYCNATVGNSFKSLQI